MIFKNKKKFFYFNILMLTQCRQNEIKSTLKNQKCLTNTIGHTTKKPINNQNHIVGGVKNTNVNDPRVTSTVLLTMDDANCTGVIVNTNLIVTAAHCLVTTSVKIEFDSNQQDSIKGPEKISKIAKKHPKASKNSFPYFDIGFVTFEGPPPAPYKPIAVYADVKNLKPKDPNDTITLAGFGLTTTKGNLSNHLRMVDTFFSKFLLPTSKPSGEGFLLYGPNKGKGSCNGDSGGPSFLKKENDPSWYALGIDNGFDSKYFPQVSEEDIENDDCNTGAEIYTAIIYHKDWLESASGEKLLLTPPPTESQTPEKSPTAGQNGADEC